MGSPEAGRKFGARSLGHSARIWPTEPVAGAVLTIRALPSATTQGGCQDP